MIGLAYGTNAQGEYHYSLSDSDDTGSFKTELDAWEALSGLMQLLRARGSDTGVDPFAPFTTIG